MKNGVEIVDHNLDSIWTVKYARFPAKNMHFVLL